MTTSFPNLYKIPPANRVPNPGTMVAYKAADGLELAMFDVEAERLMDIFAEAIIETWDPWEIAYKHLPFLAWGRGVNLWEEWWDETFKRSWVKRQWTLKSIRGTRAGLNEFVTAVGGRVKRVTTPPARTYPLPAFTDAERAAYVARFPQLRIYPYVARAQLPWLCFPGARKVGAIVGTPPSYSAPKRTAPTTIDTSDPPFEQTPGTVREEVMSPVKVSDWTTSGALLYRDSASVPIVTLREDASEGEHNIFLFSAKAMEAKNYRLIIKLQRLVGTARDVMINVGTFHVSINLELGTYTVNDGAGSVLVTGDVGEWRIELRCRSDVAANISAFVKLTNTGVASYQGDNISGIEITAVYFGSESYARNSFLGLSRNPAWYIAHTSTPGIYPGVYPTNNDAGSRYMRSATLWDRGVETPLTIRKIVKVEMGYQGGWGWTPGAYQYDEEVVLPQKDRVFYYLNQPGKGLGCGPKTGIFLGKRPALRTISIGRSGPLPLTQAQAQYQTIIPSSELINVYPKKIAVRHPIRKTELYLAKGQYLSRGKFLPPSNAWQYLYETWYLFDADRVPDYRKGGTYLGHTRLGITKYTAEAVVKIENRSPKFWVHTTGYVKGFLRPNIQARESINRLRRGVMASMLVRDTILLDTNVTRPIQVRDIINASGRVYVGQLIEK